MPGEASVKAGNQILINQSPNLPTSFLMIWFPFLHSTNIVWALPAEGVLYKAMENILPMPTFTSDTHIHFNLEYEQIKPFVSEDQVFRWNISAYNCTL